MSTVLLAVVDPPAGRRVVAAHARGSTDSRVKPRTGGVPVADGGPVEEAQPSRFTYEGEALAWVRAPWRSER
ncbi:hypothetical protein ACLQ20_11915 [Micromonospora sp. DT46]|uniref:hypothetical protein n=1 Tax=Micromonospora sp. DT46 TaxID=3393435 RepID=UPI003CF1CE78